jgi:hypothetical protein
MYIKRVVIRNIKGFETADLDLCPDGSRYPGWSVITGDNGSGKTAFLRAVSVALLGPDQYRALVPDLTGWVTEGEAGGSISVEIKPDHEIDKMSKGGYPVQGTFWAEVALTKEGGAWELNSADIYRKKKKSAVNGPWAQGTPGWFVVAYGPFRRLYGSSPDAQRLTMIPGRIPKFATLFREDATLGEGEEWAKQLMYKKLEQRPAEQLALENLLRLLKDDFLRQQVTIEEVNSEGIWLRDPIGRRIPLADMSEGYRAALAMLIDIYRHVVDVYGYSGALAERDDGSCYVSRPGVVLIDEIDAHLHPAWQREIGFWLRSHFPEIQFIVTSHSPLVCQAADDGRIYHMPSPGEGKPFILSREEYDRIITGKPDEILLTPAFGLAHTRSPRAVRARERHAVLRSRQLALGLSVEEESEMKQLDLFVDMD